MSSLPRSQPPPYWEILGGLKVRRTLLMILIIMILEGLIAFLDQAYGNWLPAGYFYIIPVIIGGLYLGFPGGVGVPVLSILLFHVVEKSIPHRSYAEADFLWLILLIVLGCITADVQRDRQRIRRHSEELERLNRAREELTALIVHDLRTPLAGLLNVMRLIEEENRASLPPGQGQLLQLALATGEGMSGMISDLLNLHAMESGALQLRETQISPADIIHAAIGQVSPLTRQRKVEIRTNLDEGLPQLRADETMLERLLVNLLGNALRFSPQGSSIIVEAKRTGSEVTFSVADEGPGIPAHLKDRIFQKFASIDHETGKHISTGLGLAFAKMAAEAHSGRIWVESPSLPAESNHPARGSRFCISLPLERR